MRSACAALLLAVGSFSPIAGAAFTFELRLIPDGIDGSAGPSPSQTFNIGNPMVSVPTRIGFWLQARVSQTTGQNWGIARASSPTGSPSFITISDPAGGSGLQRGAVNAAGTLFGRAVPYRNGGLSSGATGNAPGSASFPLVRNNENGALDNGGNGSRLTRIYGFDAYIGSVRNDDDADGDGGLDDDGDGLPENPWGVNGSFHSPAINGTPLASDGTFSPWANLYRFYVDIDPASLAMGRTVAINARALLNGTNQASPVEPGAGTFAVQLVPGQTLEAAYAFPVGPSPGAAGLLALGGLMTARRRR